MDVAALIISLVALILALVIAGFGVMLQLNLYRAAAEQTTRVSESLSNFSGELQATIRELKGQTDTMAGILKDQFNTMLDAFVRRPESVAQASRDASQSASESQNLMERLEELEVELAQASDPHQVNDMIEGIRRRVKAIAELSASAARLADPARIGYSMFQFHIRDFDESGRYKPFPADVVDLLRDLKAATDRGDSPGVSSLDEWYQSPLRVYSGRQLVLDWALSDGLLTVFVADKADPKLALTERGRRLLEVLRDMQPEDVVG